MRLTRGLRGAAILAAGVAAAALRAADGGEIRQVPLRLRIDTPVEADYYRHGGILPYVLRQLVGTSPP